jgi:hypothetical protein
MHIAIADRAGRSFPVHAHQHGFARWKKGQVTIEEESATAVVAKVKGQKTRDVVLREEKGRLLVKCTCPARTFDHPGCKHVWATLLEIDHRGGMPALRAARTPLVVAFLEAERAEAKPKDEAPPRTVRKRPARKRRKS